MTDTPHESYKPHEEIWASRTFLKEGKWFLSGTSIIPLDQYTRTDIHTAAIAERDGWQNVTGSILATVPVDEVLCMSGTVKDSVKYFRGLHDERDALRARVDDLEAAIRLATYKDGNAIRVAWDESKDLAVAHPVLMAVHNST
jgi:hypothetical protein